MPFERGTIIWETVIAGAVHREGSALLMRHEDLVREEVLQLFNDPTYKPESNDQAMSDITRWTRDVVAKYPKIEFSPMGRERIPMSRAA